MCFWRENILSVTIFPLSDLCCISPQRSCFILSVSPLILSLFYFPSFIAIRSCCIQVSFFDVKLSVICLIVSLNSAELDGFDSILPSLFILFSWVDFFFLRNSFCLFIIPFPLHSI